MNRVKLALITLFCTLSFSTTIQSMELLPYMSMSGNIKMYSQVNIKLVLISTNQTDTSCYSTSYRWGLSFINEHTYALTANGFSDYYGAYHLDMDIDGRFLSYLRKQINDGKLNLAPNLSIIDYRKLCKFKLKAIEFNANDSFLVLKENNQTVFQSVFNIEEGATDSFPFDFSESNHIRLQVNVNSSLK
jgi:hypothetical protein